ncbi:alpha/beta hydrolase [Herbidospora sp. RD11066]
MRLLASRLEEAAQEITRLQGGSVAVGLPITAPAELAHYEPHLRSMVEWCHASAAEIRKRAIIAAQADLIGWNPTGDNTARDTLMTAAAGGFDEELAAFDALGDKGDIAAFFAGLTPGQALAVALARASQVGARAGVPLELRFTANRHLVRQAHAEAIRVGDKAAADRYTRLLSPDRQLLLFDPRGPGKIAEVKGDLATARSVGIMVPGTGSNLANYEAGSVKDLKAVNEAVGFFSGGESATIMWIGAELPPNVAAATLKSYADRGAPELRAFVEGLNLGDDVKTTLIGHSYGSTLTGHAVRAGLKADNLVAVASPGWGVTWAAELQAPRTRLFAVRHPDDVISMVPPIDDIAIALGQIPPTTVMGHGSDPVFLAGVTRMSSGTDDQFLPIGVDFDAHSGYFGSNEAARTATGNVARVIVGLEPITYDEARAER